MTSYEYDPALDITLRARIAGDMLTKEDEVLLNENLHLIINEPFDIGKVPIAFGYLAFYMHVNAEIKAILEKLEPGTHRFIPVTVTSVVPINGTTEHGQYYILMRPPVVECISIEGTEFARGYGENGWRKGKDGVGGGGLPSAPNRRCTLVAEKVAGRHLWMTPVGKFLYFTASSEFWDRISHEPQAWGPHTDCLLL